MDNALTYREVGYCRVIEFGASACEPVALAELCDRVAWDEEARVVLLAFGELDDRFQTVPETAREFLVAPVAKLKQPVIAAMRGDAVGIGLELALACDLRIGTENARFGLPQIRENRIPSNGGTQRLPRLVGQGKAIQMILTGELIDAAEACRIGLVNRIVKPESLMLTAMELAQEMAGKSPLACSYAKEALYRGSDLSLDQGLTTELDLYLLLFSTSDRTEGITAFKEKRKPDFKGN